MKPATPPEPIEDPILSVVKPGPQPADDDAGRTTLDGAKRRGFVGVLHVLGPGLITGASDDDPSGIGTYAQVGSQFGYGLLWLALFTFPLMSAVQELCARIALQTGVGLGATLQRKFPRWLVGIAILGLLAANTFNVGADLGAVAAGGALLSHGTLQALWLVVPVAVLIISMEVFATYATIFKIFKWLTLALFAAELRAARADVLIGMAFSNLVMYFIILTSAAVLHAQGKTDVQTADQAAAALAPLAGPFAFIVFSVGLIGAGLLAIPILTGSATYAIKEFLGLRGSLASKPQQRPTFYVILIMATVVGVAMNFVHLDPIRALFISAVINGVVAPPLLLLIVLLGADVAVMKRYASGRLSLALTGMTTVFMAVAAIAMFLTVAAGH